MTDPMWYIRNTYLQMHSKVCGFSISTKADPAFVQQSSSFQTPSFPELPSAHWAPQKLQNSDHWAIIHWLYLLYIAKSVFASRWSPAWIYSLCVGNGRKIQDAWPSKISVVFCCRSTQEQGKAIWLAITVVLHFTG